MVLESAELGRVELQILRCVQLAPRIPFRAVSQIIGVSEQTVARRYRRLIDTGVLRVTTLVNPTVLGQSNWTVRVRCKPNGAVSLAQALAQRDDISWVSLVSGGSEIVCVLRARTSEARDDLLTQRLPRTAPVLGISALMVLHRFVGDGSTEIDDWSALEDVLDVQQQAAVLARATPQHPGRISAATLSREDELLLDVLAQDGRTSFAALAKASGLDEAAATRRLRALLAGGVAYFDVDVSVAALGFHTTATLFLTVPPADLDAVGRRLAAEREVAYVAAVSGPQNLTASVICRDVDHLYRFVTDRIGGVPGITGLEILPILRHVKQAGALTSGDRLIPV